MLQYRADVINALLVGSWCLTLSDSSVVHGFKDDEGFFPEDLITHFECLPSESCDALAALLSYFHVR